MYPDPFTVTSTGGTGERLTIAGDGWLKYDFRRATKIVNKGRLKGKRFASWTLYRKTLRIKASFTGGAEGRIAAVPRTATGDATVRIVVTAPKKSDSGTMKSAPEIRAGALDMAIPTKGTCTCTAKFLKVAEKVVYTKARGGGTATSRWTYRRL